VMMAGFIESSFLQQPLIRSESFINAITSTGDDSERDGSSSKLLSAQETKFVLATSACDVTTTVVSLDWCLTFRTGTRSSSNPVTRHALLLDPLPFLCTERSERSIASNSVMSRLHAPHTEPVRTIDTLHRTAVDVREEATARALWAPEKIRSLTEQSCHLVRDKEFLNAGFHERERLGADAVLTRIAQAADLH